MAVSGGERDTHATRSGRQKVHEALARGVESIDAGLSSSLRRAAVQTFVFVSHEVEVVAEDVEDDGELREDENLVPLSLELREELVQEHHLTAGLRDHVQRLWGAGGVGVLSPFSTASFAAFSAESSTARFFLFAKSSSIRSHKNGWLQTFEVPCTGYEAAARSCSCSPPSARAPASRRSCGSTRAAPG